MANANHVDLLLNKGVEAWNAWRESERVSITRDPDRPGPPEDLIKILYPDVIGPDLSGANLAGLELVEADLSWANLVGADLRKADLHKAKLRNARLFQTNLSGAILDEANFFLADLIGAHLGNACLFRAKLNSANLNWAKLENACLREAELMRASLVGADLTGADLTGCRVHGVNAWEIKLDKSTKQQNLVITAPHEPEITADDIEVAQFIYLLLHNEKIRDVIDTMTSKVVLILGRFTPARKQVLDALRNELRRRNYLPVVFDFEKPSSQTTDETITLLARMARFVIADLSDAKSILQELRGIVPDLPSVAVQPLILIPQEEPGMFDFIRKYPWVLKPYSYDSQEHLLANLDRGVVDPAEAKVLELRGNAVAPPIKRRTRPSAVKGSERPRM